MGFYNVFMMIEIVIILIDNESGLLQPNFSVKRISWEEMGWVLLPLFTQFTPQNGPGVLGALLFTQHVQ